MTPPLTIMAIFPHPDDTAFFASGTLARWAAEGHRIISVCCTSGDMGTLHIDQKREDVARIRERELRAADRVLGVTETVTLGYPDGGVLDAAQLRRQLIQLVRYHRPHRVLTLDPWLTYEIHPDHRMVGQLAGEAATFAAFPLLHPEQFDKETTVHTPDEVWFMGLLSRRPNLYVDISSSLETKVAAALKYEGTLAILAKMFAPDTDPAHLPPDHAEKLAAHADAWLRAMAAKVGKKAKLAAAEAFFVETCLAGHFDNMDRLMDEMLGEPEPPPRVV